MNAMRKHATLVLAVSLMVAECAVTPGYYRNHSTMELCTGLMTLPSYNVNHGERIRELERRGANCSKYGSVPAAQAEPDRQMQLLPQLPDS
jgi:hypothetical protein